MPTIKMEKPIGRVRNRPLKDYSGQRFGRLVAQCLVERDLKYNNHLWRFACDCGTIKTLRIKLATTGSTTSCGCLKREQIIARNSTHGLTRKHAGEYRSWKDMRSRCNTPTDSDYKDYGGRGIRVCARWDDFAAFYADMGDRPEGHTLDRIDVNGDYDPGNCRWAPDEVQANNKRGTVKITHNGETLSISQWARRYGLGVSLLSWRVRSGWPLDRLFDPPR